MEAVEWENSLGGSSDIGAYLQDTKYEDDEELHFTSGTSRTIVTCLPLLGGGVALLYAAKGLESLPTVNEDQKIGVKIIQNALKALAFTIASNAGFDGALVIGKLLEQDNHYLVFDAAKGVYVDMAEKRIIDPLKMVRMALVDVASISLLLTTSEATVFDHPNEKNNLRAVRQIFYTT